MKKRLVLIVALIVFIGGVVLYFSPVFHKRVTNKAQLADLLGMDFTDFEVTDIQCSWNKGTDMIVFLNESEEALQSREYYGGLVYQDLEHIPHGNIAKLREIGIEKDDIKQYGYNFTGYNMPWGGVRKQFFGMN